MQKVSLAAPLTSIKTRQTTSTRLGLRSFLGSEAVRNDFLQRVQEHAAKDEIVKGKYWENGKGCAVGCTIHSGNHEEYRSSLGLPVWLAKIEDKIFENMSNQGAKEFPRSFLEAIRVGVEDSEMDKVKRRFYHWLLTDPTYGVKQHTRAELAGAIQTVADYHEACVKSETPNWNELQWAKGIISSILSGSSKTYFPPMDATRTAKYSLEGLTLDKPIGSKDYQPLPMPKSRDPLTAIYCSRAVNTAGMAAEWSGIEADNSNISSQPLRTAQKTAAYDTMAEKLLELLSQAQPTAPIQA